MILTDTHTHLFASEFEPDRNDSIEAAIEQGVSRLFLPNIDSTSIEAMLKLSGDFPRNCFPTIGLHPCSVKENYKEELEIVRHWLFGQKSQQFYGVGEIGIDLYWDKTFIEEQKEAFRTQVKWAKDLKLPIIIHTRNSFPEAFEIVREEKNDDLKGIFHCFSGTIEEAEKIIALKDFKLGIGGVVTFKNSGLDKVVKAISLEHLVLETDSPYLAPVPHRGKRNESSYIRLIADKIAEIKNVSLEEVAVVTTENSKKIFGV